MLANEANDVLICSGLDVHHLGSGRLTTSSAIGSDCVVVELFGDAIESDPISGAILDVAIAGLSVCLKGTVSLFVSFVFVGSVGYGLHDRSDSSGCG